MDPSSLYPTLVLNVNLGCCHACVVKMNKLLEKTEGVHAFDINPQAGLVTVWGKVNHAKLINKVKKINRNAKLVSYEEPKKKNAPDKASGSQQTDKASGSQKKINNDHEHMEGHSGASHGHGNHHAPPMTNFHPPPPSHYQPPPPPRDGNHHAPPMPNFHHPPHPHYPQPSPLPSDGNHHAPPMPNFHPPPQPHYLQSPPSNWQPQPPPPPPDWQPYPPSPDRQPQPHYYGHHHAPTTDNMSHYFNDENTTGCLIM